MSTQFNDLLDRLNAREEADDRAYEAEQAERAAKELAARNRALVERRKSEEAAARDAQLPQAMRKAVERDRANKGAREYLAAEEASALTLPNGVSMRELLASPPEEEMFTVEGLLHDGGNALVAAQRKAGKTTLRNELIRSLVDGEPFLDHFHVNRTRRVAVLDLEMNEATTFRWFEQLGIENTDDVLVFHLRGSLGSLALTDGNTRARWAEKLKEFGAKVLILDPIRPLLDALGLDENRDAGVVLNAFDSLKKEAGVSEGVVIHHSGHGAGGRARGDSRFEDWPDSILRLTTDDPNDTSAFRYLSAQGRDVDVPRGLVSMYDERRLAYAPESSERSKARKDETVIDAVLHALETHGERSTGQLVDLQLKGLTRNTAPKILERAVKSGKVLLRQEGTAKLYRLSE